MRRFLFVTFFILPAWLLAPLARCQSDSMIHVNQFRGTTVADKVTAAMAHCPAAPIPCYLVIDASLAAAASGTMPTLPANAHLVDYRISWYGNSAMKPAASDNVQYVSNTGSDSNDGLSWGSAKLTVAAACAALPGGNNTCTGGSGSVYIAPSFTGTVLIPEIFNNNVSPPAVQVIYLPSTGRTITLGSGSFPMDGSGLQSAVTDLCAAGQAGGLGMGGTILIPDGAIYVQSTIDISNCSIRIVGSGVLSSILNFISGGGTMFLIDHSIGGIEVRNVAMYETTTANSPAIQLSGTSVSGNEDVTLSDVLFAGGSDTGAAEIGIEFSANTGDGYSCIDCIFHNVIFTGNQQAIKTVGTRTPNGEGNLWSNIDVRLYSGAAQTVSPIVDGNNSDEWTNVRFENGLSAGVPAFVLSGALNKVSITCDTGQPCISDTGAANKWNVTFISGSVGTKSASSSAWVGDVTKNVTYFIPASGILSTFPACSSALAGTQIAVTDSTTQTWGATITGSGTFPAQGYCDGTNWTVIGK